MLKVILGSFGAFPIFDNFLSEKPQVLERKVNLKPLCLLNLQLNVVIFIHLVKQRAKPLGFLFFFMAIQKLATDKYTPYGVFLPNTLASWPMVNTFLRRPVSAL